MKDWNLSREVIPPAHIVYYYLEAIFMQVVLSLLKSFAYCIGVALPDVI